ncbi:MAG: hypothetical protein SPH18_08035 [Sutterella parvirubra]|nr:hypothetical protein [Sutterella parvirubra]
MATAKKVAPKKMGRPTKYTQALADRICALIADGVSEREICAMPGMPTRSTLWEWKETIPEFSSQSARARVDSAEVYEQRRQNTARWLIREAESRAASGENFPKGVVEAMKAVMQEDARSASWRDGERFGDRKKVALTGADGGAIKTETTLRVELTPKQREMLDRLLDDEY